MLWLEFIKRLKQTGMSISKMQTYAKLRYEGTSTLSQRRQLFEKQLVILEVEQLKLASNIKLLKNKIALYHEQEGELP